MKITVQQRTVYAYTGGRPLDRQLPGVVFVHGALHDHSVWSLQSRYLAHHGHAVLAVDLPGHGRSAGTALDIPGAGQWLTTLIEQVGLHHVVLVGHSMGSLIALEAAARLGTQAHTLVMVGTAYPMKVSDTLLQLAQTDPQRGIDWVNQLSVSSYASKPSHPGPGFSIHGGNRALMRRTLRGYTADNLFYQDFAACNAYAGLEAAAPALTCSVHVVAGRKDQMTPARAAQPVAHALHAQVHTLDCGHAIMAEAPDALLHIIMQAARSHPISPASPPP